MLFMHIVWSNLLDKYAKKELNSKKNAFATIIGVNLLKCVAKKYTDENKLITNVMPKMIDRM